MNSRWLWLMLFVIAVFVWVVWQPQIPAPAAFWDSKP